MTTKSREWLARVARTGLGRAWSIRARIITSTVAALVILAVIFATYFPARQQQAAIANLERETERMAEMVAIGVAVGLELNQLPAVAAVVNSAKEDPALAYLRVVDSAGALIGHYGRNRAADSAATAATAGGTTSDLIQRAVPIRYHGERLGTVFLGLSLAETHAAATAFRVAALTVAGAALLLGLALALELANRIGKPIRRLFVPPHSEALRRLRAAADQVAAGNYDVAIAPGGDQEMARLAQAFEIMVGRVRESHRQLADNSVSLADARDSALAAARTKAEFLAAMSHEIRTPMNGVVGMLGLLAETPLTAKQGEFVRTASNSAGALLTVIDDILDFSKIEAGKLTLEHTAFDLREAVEDVGQLLAEQAHRKNLELTCLVPESVPCSLMGDPVRLRQLLLNLGGNAVKFTQKGEVWIRVSVQRQVGDRVQLLFEITDTGIGMTADVQTRLFQPFMQADNSTTRRFGGTGLGLSISRRLVDLMGGAIGVRSTEGRGTTFWFRLELAQAPDAPPAPEVSGLKGIRVLVVDDHETNRLILEKYLAARGVEVLLATNADDARGALERAGGAGALPAVALIDGAMPNETGHSLARSLRLDPRFDAIRLVLLSSAGDGPDSAATHDDFDARLSKPIRLLGLIDTMLAFFGRGAQRPAPAPNHRPGPQVVASHGLTRILLAEDHEINRLLAVEILAGAGYQVDVVGNGAEAVEARSRHRYDLLLMDCQMPVMDGFEATRLIRRREAAGELGRRVPIVAITANAIEGDREVCLAAGMDGYLSKPFTPRGLLMTVSEWTPGRPADPAPAPGRPIGAPSPTQRHSPIAIEQLNDLVGNNATKVRRYLDMFVELTGPSLDQLRAAVVANDGDQARRLAHKIKGSCGMVGARGMAAIAAELERQAGDGNLVDGTIQVDRLEAAFGAARTFAADYSGTPS